MVVKLFIVTISRIAVIVYLQIGKVDTVIYNAKCRTNLRAFALLINDLSAGQARDNSVNANDPNLDISIGLKHRIVIPKILYFRIGSANFGQVDKVTIDLNNSSGFNSGTNAYFGVNPLGSGLDVAATNNGALQVDLRGNAGTVTLSYQVSSSTGLVNGSATPISYSEISTISDNTDLPAPILINAASNSASVAGNLFSGRVVNRQAVWTYSYKNNTTPTAGTYTGTVIYTASTP